MSTDRQQLISLAVCVESPTNPRREFSKAAFDELAASIREVGVLQPILVRQGEGGKSYEVVCGSRRFAAARAAGLEEIPAVIREMTDDQVVEIQMIENLQREDLSPIDEAEGYQTLINRGRTVEEIAASTHKSKATVYGRLQLLNLPPAARKALQTGKMTASVAGVIARIPNEQLRVEAAKEIAGEARFLGGRQLSFHEASRLVRRKYMLDLATAPFSTKAADLLPNVGACTDCPHRTGNATDLFGDVLSEGKRGADVCTNPPCFEKKRTAATERALVAAKEKGLQVLGPAETKKVFPHGSKYVSGSEYVDPSGKCHHDPKWRTWGALLGKDAPAAVVAIDGEGVARHLLPAAAALAVLREKHSWAKAKRSAISSGQSPAEKRRRQEQQTKNEVNQAVLAEVVAAAEADKMRTPSPAAMKALTVAAISRAWHETLKGICSRRGLADPKKKARPEDLLLKHLESLDGARTRGLLVEILLSALSGMTGTPEQIKAATAAFGVDRAAIEKRVRAEIAAKHKTTAKKSAGKSKPKPASRKKQPAEKACSVCGCTEDNACAGGCAWEPRKKGQPLVCTRCAGTSI